MSWWRTIAQDLRYAFKRLRKNPGITFIIISTLAVGLAACTVIFSVVDALMLRPLPVRDPKNLVQLSERYPSLRLRPQSYFPYELYRTLQARSSTLFDAVGQVE